jgi:hypothetical protein
VNEKEQSVERLLDLPKETRELLASLTKEDVATITTGLPIIRMIISFGKVTKWLAITAFGVLVGVAMLSDSVSKIIDWFKHP